MNDPSSYRPVSLLIAACFSKIFEKVLYIQLLEYLETNKLWDMQQQQGFGPSK